MAKVTIDAEKCKGCGLCVMSCPKKTLKMSEEWLNSKGYYPAEVINMDDCIACAFCAVMCPECAIKVEK